jgi:glycosyltransferase involved in cell wall biosynthesis
MKRIDCAIGHSRLEVERYRRIFPGKTSFSFIPWGGNVNGSDAYAARSDRREEAAVVSLLAAGRSGRDYGTLVRAIKDLHNVSLTIVCDQSEPLKDIKETDQVTILRHCYGFAYLEQIEKASIVIVPLMVEDISAGQMVLIQAMAYGKPIIVTRAATVLDYVEDQKEALLVDRGDVNQMRTAIETLLANPAMRLSLGRAGRQAYETRFNQTAMTNNTLKAVQQLSKAA